MCHNLCVWESENSVWTSLLSVSRYLVLCFYCISSRDAGHTDETFKDNKQMEDNKQMDGQTDTQTHSTGTVNRSAKIIILYFKINRNNSHLLAEYCDLIVCNIFR